MKSLESGKFVHENILGVYPASGTLEGYRLPFVFDEEGPEKNALQNEKLKSFVKRGHPPLQHMKTGMKAVFLPYATKEMVLEAHLKILKTSSIP